MFCGQGQSLLVPQVIAFPMLFTASLVFMKIVSSDILSFAAALYSSVVNKGCLMVALKMVDS